MHDTQAGIENMISNMKVDQILTSCHKWRYVLFDEMKIARVYVIDKNIRLTKCYLA